MVRHPDSDLILLDIQLPEMDGYTFLNELRKLEEGKSIPVIVLTAHPNLTPIFTLKGVSCYLVKPIPAEELLSRIEKALSPEENISFP